MSEMIERIAMVLKIAEVGDRTPWDECDKGYKQAKRRQARAAIEAMREPTDDMRVPESAKVIWRGMIDEALATPQS